ncbi:hypothetical protein GCK72_005585 [Caenorhabditis remanei]|uniref:ISXO2-like transposase domain-containing protein n=1 Tax=Caenorhabditis remanei TaxID=31234 RepID=A0A6A5HHY8_CAERE|nr:hypothetical protein GCK72_005585 [Caenorhabditis remanei]KAF1765632.1 hypothetical protein GCK72_005585 [Caenorhabditis remanei]
MALSKIGSIVSISQIDAIYPTEKDLIYDLMESGLLKKDRMCDKCGASMKLRSRGDGLEWRCRTSNKKDCSSKSVKAESWFRHSNLDFKTALRIFVGFSSKLSGIQLERELHLSHSTIVDWSSMIREICVGIADNYGMIGGDGKVVELDETAVHSRKYGRGIQKAPTVWILGGLERGTRNVFATIVPNRTAKTMVPIIRKNVHAGSILVTDKWGSYNKLSQYYSRHENLNHGTEFARTADDGLSVNTNSVEAAWARLKEPLKRGHGTTDDNLPGYIAEFVVRERESRNFLTKMLTSIVIKE